MKILDKILPHSFLIIMLVICVGITYMAVVHPMLLANYEFDRVYDDVMDDVDNGNSSPEFKEGWIAALKHFKVLWYSGSNATGG